jgi:hypothetical protein
MPVPNSRNLPSGDTDAIEYGSTSIVPAGG